MTLKNAGTDQISALCIYFYRIAEFLCPTESKEDIIYRVSCILTAYMKGTVWQD
jgi:hypothetical protein